MAIQKVLVVDDENLIRQFLSETLRRKNIEVTLAENGVKAVEYLKKSTFDLVITDMKMPDLTGIDILRKTKELSPSTIVIVITGFGSIENAIEATRLGAFNYIIKPFSPDTIEAIIEKANEHLSLLEENQGLRLQIISSEKNRDKHIVIAASPVMKKIIEDVKRIAQSQASVLIHGESGTGKEVVAKMIHEESLRNTLPFIKVNCAAIPETLIESEFFGHEKGSFTGAHAKRLGRFELANKGTLLLDEITEIPLNIQVKLLRVIQEQEFERVGGSSSIKVDVRLISTTNREIKDAIANKILREDLYYRLNVVPIYLPPLRERPEDILALADYFLEKICFENHKAKKFLTQEAKNKLLKYGWPGNIRELANIIERAVVMTPATEISPEYIYLSDTQDIMFSAEFDKKVFKLPVGSTLEELEKQLIIETLLSHLNNKTQTAKTLGISIRTLRNKLNQYNISNQGQFLE